MPPLTLTPLVSIPLIHSGDDLVGILARSLEDSGIHLREGDILVLAQKIISKAEGRMVRLADITPGPEALELAARAGKDPRFVELLLRESAQVLRVRTGTIIVEHRLGFICANAGIDHSNVAASGVGEPECVLLLPEKPEESARAIRQGLSERFGVTPGVVIIDSHGRAWRNGTVGIAIGVSGVPGLVDLRGEPDLFGYRLQITQVGAADELAAAASLMMGQAAEGTPAVHVRGFPYPLREGSLRELIRPKDEDLFR